jgi:hypothetical protein
MFAPQYHRLWVVIRLGYSGWGAMEITWLTSGPSFSISMAEADRCRATFLCQNCVKTPSVWGIGSCYLSESSFPTLLITGTSV